MWHAQVKPRQSRFTVFGRNPPHLTLNERALKELPTGNPVEVSFLSGVCTEQF